MEKKNNNEGEKNKKKTDSSINKKQSEPIFIDTFISYQALTPYDPIPIKFTDGLSKIGKYLNQLRKTTINIVNTEVNKKGFIKAINGDIKKFEDALKDTIDNVIKKDTKYFRPFIVYCDRVAIIPISSGIVTHFNESFELYSAVMNEMIKRFSIFLHQKNEYKDNGILVCLMFSYVESGIPFAVFTKRDRYTDFEKVTFRKQGPDDYNDDFGISDESY